MRFMTRGGRAAGTAGLARLLLGFALGVAVTAGAAGALPAPAPLPTLPAAPPAGILIPEDRYHYHFGWQGIPAFTGFIEATRHEEQRPWYHFRLEGKTRRWLEPLYPMRDVVDAYVDGVTYLPQFFYARLRAPRDDTDMKVTFDHNRRVADARWTSNGKEKAREIPFRRGNDPVSVLFMLQSLSEPGDSAAFEVVNGKRNYQVGLRVTGRERVTVPAGTFETLVIVPTLTRTDKPDYKPKFKEMTVWVTDGEMRVPVKLESKVFIGSVTGELVEITPKH